MSEVSFINKVKPLRSSPLVVIIAPLRLATPQFNYYCYTIKEKTNECEAGICWAKVVRPSY